MKKSITLILSLVVCGISYGKIQKPAEKQKNTFGLMFGPGYKSSFEGIYTLGVRVVHPINKFFAAGLEANYQQLQNLYVNADAIGGICFARVTPYNHGFFSELGFQYAMTVSSARSQSSKVYLPYLALGYKAKLNNRVNLEFQVRPFSCWSYHSGNEYVKNNFKFNVPSKFFIGLNYSF